MPLYPGMPYGQAPSWCYPFFEGGLYILFVLCLIHAIKQGYRDLIYLLGGLIFGLLLEYMEVVLGSYAYGRFNIMLGTYPLDIPLGIGVGWGIIMYTARLFTDRLGLSLLACAALDTLLALNIDLSMDVVAYRTHMWHWNWEGTGLDPLTAQWFGVPFGNFIGWQTVVFCYSAFSRLFERELMRTNRSVVKWIAVAILTLLCSIIVLYTTQAYLFPVLADLGIRSVHRFLGISLILIIVAFWGWRQRVSILSKFPGIMWIVPVWFHVSFGVCFFILGFYSENKWMTIATCVNLLIGLIIHVLPLFFKQNNAKSVKYK